MPRPACAGKTPGPARRRARHPLDPRLRGEDAAAVTARTGDLPRPPPARGRLVGGQESPHVGPSTPACAGKTTCPSSCPRPSRLDPRLRGEDIVAGVDRGLVEHPRPPPARGRQDDYVAEYDRLPSTPACAGKTRCGSTTRSASTLDPRLRGGRRGRRRRVAGCCIPTPRLRGKTPTAWRRDDEPAAPRPSPAREDAGSWRSGSDARSALDPRLRGRRVRHGGDRGLDCLDPRLRGRTRLHRASAGAPRPRLRQEDGTARLRRVGDLDRLRGEDDREPAIETPGEPSTPPARAGRRLGSSGSSGQHPRPRLRQEGPRRRQAGLGQLALDPRLRGERPDPRPEARPWRLDPRLRGEDRAWPRVELHAEPRPRLRGRRATRRRGRGYRPRPACAGSPRPPQLPRRTRPRPHLRGEDRPQAGPGMRRASTPPARGRRSA